MVYTGLFLSRQPYFPKKSKLTSKDYTDSFSTLLAQLIDCLKRVQLLPIPTVGDPRKGQIMSRYGLFLILIAWQLNSCGIKNPRYIAYEPQSEPADNTSTDNDPANDTPAGTDDDSSTSALNCDAATAFTTHLTSAFTTTGCSCHAATPPIPTGNAATDGQAFYDAAIKRGSAQALFDYLSGSEHTGATQVSSFTDSFEQWVADCDAS